MSIPLFTLGQASMPMWLIHSICTLQTMSDGDHVCFLLFDEMSIWQNLHFSQKFGCIEGFERHLSSGFRIEKLQIYLVLPTSLNVPETFS